MFNSVGATECVNDTDGTTGCFNKVYPILIVNFEKPRALMSLCIISYDFHPTVTMFFCQPIRTDPIVLSRLSYVTKQS